MNVRRATTEDLAVLEELWRAFEAEVPPLAHEEADVGRELAEIREIVESGLGWSLVPSLDPDGPAGRRLAAFPLQRPRMTFPVVMAWRKDMPENPMFDALLECAPGPQRRG